MVEGKRTKRPVQTFVVDLPSIHDLGFYVATPQYAKVQGMAVTQATTPRAAVGNIVFRTLPQDVGKRVMAALKEHSRAGLAGYAFAIPEVMPVDGKPLSAEEKNYFRHAFLASDIQQTIGGDELRHMPYAEKLIRFYNSNPQPTK